MPKCDYEHCMPEKIVVNGCEKQNVSTCKEWYAIPTSHRTITPALECAPISHASKTENSNDVATPPNSRPIIRIVKFLKSAVSSGEREVSRG